MSRKISPKTDLILNDLQQTRLIDFGFKIELINKVLNDSQISLNSLQLINFLNYYFDENADEIEHRTSGNLSICFPCIACSAQFSYEQTFHLHLDRRAIFLKLHCSECKQTKVFFNKCKLFYHIYSHKSSLFEPKYNKIQIDQIPVEKASQQNSKHSESLNFIFSSLHGLITQNPRIDVNLSINHRFKLNEQDLHQIKLFIKRLKNNRFLSYKCPVCDALFLDYKDLKLHFIQSRKHDSEYLTQRTYFKTLKEKYLNSQIKNSNDEEDINIDILNTFSLDKLQYSTKCSQLVNLNLIEINFKFFNLNNISRQRLICPECGLVFDYSLNKNYIELFKLHLKYDCLFMLRYDMDEIKCLFSMCNQTFNSSGALLNHWCTDHVIKNHQCESCIKNKQETEFEEIDKLESGLSINLISQINKHYFEKHKNEGVSITTRYGCQCKMTNLYDETKCQLFNNVKNLKSHLMDQINRALLSIDCFVCKKLVLSKDYVSHMKDHEDEKFYVCPECGPVMGQEPSLHVHILRNHLQTTGLKSSYCKLLDDKKESNAQTHVYLCLNCRLFFSNESKFCHNCWSPLQPTNSNNYFSPIYLKFNVNKFMDMENNNDNNKQVNMDDDPDIIVIKDSQPE
ncbi:unnamed protein product [Brachionus calyciflorus]|uniref:C2H2-type domain-containing protein n=1 Tax=Brachionus calyciflorus TaxID=104777 RepID=A0A813N991_9BILA|nr:unnamed protein product [Brachionus calyciflorus]